MKVFVRRAPRGKSGDEETRKTRHVKRWKIAAGALLLLLFFAACDYVFYPRFARVAPHNFNRGRNGLWLNEKWYRGQSREYSQLARHLKNAQIGSAYFHVRYIGKSGRLRFREETSARQLNEEMKRRAPQVQRFAWIFVGNERAITGVDLGDEKVRARMVVEAVWLVEKCGFGGVQWDYEICADGDANFLKLLKETRAALPKTAKILVATSMWLPRGLGVYGWSENYFAQVAARCDELVVMGYDSGLYFPRPYVWLMREQAARVTRASTRGNAKCRVLIGVPTYERGGWSHHAGAENLKMALVGVVDGLNDARAKPVAFAGIALFSDDATDREEWNFYRAAWLRGAS